MPTFGTPAPQNSGSYDLTFDYDIDPTHSGSLTISVPNPPDANEDTTVLEDLIAVLSAHADWDFAGGWRVWPTAQQITP